MYEMNYPECKVCNTYQCGTCGAELNDQEEKKSKCKVQEKIKDVHSSVVARTTLIIIVQLILTIFLESNLRGVIGLVLAIAFGYFSITKHHPASKWSIYFVTLLVFTLCRLIMVLMNSQYYIAW